MFCAKYIYPNFAPTVRAVYIKQYVSIEYIKWNILQPNNPDAGKQKITQQCYISKTRADGEIPSSIRPGESQWGKGYDPFLKPSEYWRQGHWDESGKPTTQGDWASGRMFTGPLIASN